VVAGPGDFFTLPPERVAVVLIDFQKRFLQPARVRRWPGPEHGQRGRRRPGEHVRAAATELGAHVVYTRQVLDPDRLSSRQRRWERPDGICAVGSWGAELFVEPVPRSTVVTKNRFDHVQLDLRPRRGQRIQVMLLAPCPVGAQVGLGVSPGRALEPGQIARDGQLEPVTVISEGVGQALGGGHALTVSRTPAVGSAEEMIN